jgi:hypothetical protein
MLLAPQHCQLQYFISFSGNCKRRPGWLKSKLHLVVIDDWNREVSMGLDWVCLFE